MNDRELLEMAANAAGMKGWQWVESWGSMAEKRLQGGFYFDRYWNPIEDDGDALRLAVKLGILVQSECYDDYNDMYAAAYKYDNGVEIASVQVPYTSDPYSASRWAIVQLAAILGRKMNEH